MSHLVMCTFDLKQASKQDYDNAYADLASVGLERVIVADNSNNVVIPTTTVAGTIDGQSATTIRDNICDKVQALFRARRFTSEIFVVVGGDWAWGARTT